MAQRDGENPSVEAVWFAHSVPLEEKQLWQELYQPYGPVHHRSYGKRASQLSVNDLWRVNYLFHTSSKHDANVVLTGVDQGDIVAAY
jgi:hypothetical protein